MAGDWIKLETTTPDKPEVVAMADKLNLDQDAVVGKLVRLWIWADANSLDGHALSVTDPFLDRLTYCPGFAAALRRVGWLSGRDGRLTIPNFDRHNGKPAKSRALGKTRKARSRNCHAASVTETGPEKRREEGKNRERENAGAKRPSLDQAKACAQDIGITPAKAEEWWHAREASDWIKGAAGGGTMPVGDNWQADLTTYCKRGPMNDSRRQKQPGGTDQQKMQQVG